VRARAHCRAVANLSANGHRLLQEELRLIELSLVPADDGGTGQGDALGFPVAQIAMDGECLVVRGKSFLPPTGDAVHVAHATQAIGLARMILDGARLLERTLVLLEGERGLAGYPEHGVRKLVARGDAFLSR